MDKEGPKGEINMLNLHSKIAEAIKEKFAKWNMDIMVVVNADEVIAEYDNGETYSGGHRVVKITTLDDVVDISMYYGDHLTYHEVLNATAKDGYADVKDGFCCDADCGVLAAVQEMLGIDWSNIANRYETLCQQLDRAIEAAKKPSLEEWLTDKISHILEEDPGEWDIAEA